MTSHPTSPPQADQAVRPSAVPLYVGGGALSMLGNASIGIVLPWLVIATTGDLSTTALVATAAGIAAVPASLLGGRLADRFGARRVAVAADLGSALAVAGLAVVDATVGLTVGWFVALGVLGALFDVPGMSARQALLADVARVGGRRVDVVASAYQTAFSLSFLVGPAMAGLLLAHLDPVDVVWVTAACSATAGLLTWCVPVANPSVAGADPLPGGGWGALRRDPRLGATLVIAFAATFVTAPLLSVVLPGHFADLGEPGSYGATVSAFAVGTIVGSILFAVLSRRSRLLAYVVGIGAMTTGMVGIAGLGGVLVVGGAMAVMGVGSGLYGPVWNVFVAEQVPSEVRARVLGVINALALVAGPLGLGALTLLLTVADLGVAAVATAAVWVCVGVFAILNPHARAVAGDGQDGEHADDR
ncbi:MFS transporter [Aeromicrobium alkaliterrae]|uniref:Multidrug efflux pump Tap n=1 Tax=Aeromicrobium alkaliterrae TaxID=302168 RepID=A0ABN2JKQ7_9ACTN